MPEADRPQPRKDVERERGMAVFVGRLRACPVLDYKFVALGHNTSPRRGRRGGAECRTDAVGRAARLMIVMKFGGTSVESAAAIERVAGIVKARLTAPPRRGGFGHGQDHQQAAGHRERRHSRASARSTFGRFTICAISTRAKPGRWCRSTSALTSKRTLDEHFQELTELVKGIAVLGELTPRSIDAISSYGERLSSYIVTLAFRHFGLPAVHVDSRKVIVTDSATRRPRRCSTRPTRAWRQPCRRLPRRQVVVMGGFIGSTEEGVTTTLGRGGSDFTASIVGAGIGAEEIQIWTDVDGMLTADPTILPGGHRVKSISFAEAAELAYFGAKVLHPATVLPASREEHSGADSELAAAGSARHAHRRRARCPARNAVKSIACKRNITLVNIQSTRMLMAHGFLRRIFEVFDRYRNAGGYGGHHRGQRVADHRQSGATRRDHRGELREFAEVTHRARSGDRLPGGREHPRHAGRGARASSTALEDVNVRMISPGRVAAEHQRRGRRKQTGRRPSEALHEEFFAKLDPESSR